MSVAELKDFLKEHRVPKKFYKIDGSHNKRICLEQAKDGWDVFFQDHKQRVGVLHFQDEASACQAMKNELRKMMEQMFGLTFAR